MYKFVDALFNFDTKKICWQKIVLWATVLYLTSFLLAKIICLL